MLRADNVICGTSTTGTGTLTLAACPAPPGGLDFDKWLKATGYGFVSTNALVVSYTIIEYTSSAFTTAKQTEKGVGTLTLGSSITAASLARTVVQSSITGLNGTPAPTFSSPTAITIGTAANTLVFIGASTAEILACSGVRDTSLAGINGYPPLMTGLPTTGGGTTLVNNQDWTTPFIWAAGSMLVKRVYTRVESAYTGAVSNLYIRLYQPNASGQQSGKLLYDFGVVGPSNASFGTAITVISSGAAGNGFFMTPGEYFIQFCPIWTTSGGSGTPQLTKWGAGSGPINSGFRGANGVGINATQYDNSANATAPDPAPTALGTIGDVPVFFFSDS